MALPNEPVIIKGTVTELLEYGAMMKLVDGSVGLVHISEVSGDYVYDVRDYLNIGMEVDVAVIGNADSGKKRLSIKQANVILSKLDKSEIKKRPTKEEREEKKARKKQLLLERQEQARRRLIDCPPDDLKYESGSEAAFEDKLKKYMKESDSRLVDVKHQQDAKIGENHRHG